MCNPRTNGSGNRISFMSFAYPPPSDGKPFRLTLGLRELDPRNWIEFDSGSKDQIAERNALIDTKREIVYQVIEGHQEGINYFCSALEENLRAFHGEHLPQSFSLLGEQDPLLQLARVICEDLCILRKVNGRWILVAGLVIFPSRWDLREKIGLDIDAIHGPVPGYQESLEPVLSDTFDRLKPERPVWRRNWSLHATSKLHEPKFEGETSPIENFWWRTERQTLTKSLDSQFILFTIRNRAEPFSRIKSDPATAQAFAQTLETLTPEMLAYKRIVDEKSGLLDYLRS